MCHKTTLKQAELRVAHWQSEFLTPGVIDRFTKFCTTIARKLRNRREARLFKYAVTSLVSTHCSTLWSA